MSVFDSFSIIALQLSRESYFLLSLATVILVNLVQPENIPAPMLLTELHRVKVSKPVHSRKAYEPMVVNELGVVILVNPVQPQKAYSPIFVTELGMVISVKPVQP